MILGLLGGHKWRDYTSICGDEQGGLLNFSWMRKWD